MHKGYIFDLAVYTVLLFAFAVSLLLAFIFFSSYNDVLVENGMNTTASETAYAGMGIMDSAYAFLFLGLIIALLVSVFLINTHPAFFFVIIIAWVFIIFVGVIFSNTFESIATTDVFQPYATDFPMMLSIMANLPKIITIVGMLMIILLVGKRRLMGAMGGGYV